MTGWMIMQSGDFYAVFKERRHDLGYLALGEDEIAHDILLTENPHSLKASSLCGKAAKRLADRSEAGPPPRLSRERGGVQFDSGRLFFQEPR